MTKRRWMVMCGAAALLLLARTPASADTITLEGYGPFPIRPGDVLRLGFDLTGFSPDIYQPSNVLVVLPGVIVVDPVDSFTVRLIDRGQLLGTYTGTPSGASGSFASRFMAPGTDFTLGNPTVVDFSSFRNGTFDGRVEFQINSGRANIWRVSDELDLDVALSPTVASGAGFAPRTFEMVVPSQTPEPASLILLGSGVAALAMRSRRGRREA